VTGIAAVLVVGGIFLLNHHRGMPPTLRIISADHLLAPNFSLSDLNGEKLSLSAYGGKVVLLDFWATWCEPCREEIPHFVELQNKYRDQGLQIIGISMDEDPEPVRKFYRQFKMNYPVVMGNAKTGELYGGILGLPIAFVIGRDRRIYSKHIGATDIPVFDSEIKAQLQDQEPPPANQ
jgi:thiol-disulfide isomerase/thioredoxin